eukprot:scaffold195453_cov35-Tisochrysis_lutea.AAC.1
MYARDTVAQQLRTADAIGHRRQSQHQHQLRKRRPGLGRAPARIFLVCLVRSQKSRQHKATQGKGGTKPERLQPCMNNTNHTSHKPPCAPAYCILILS